MLAYRLNGPSLDQLVFGTEAEPVPGDGEVIVRMKAAAINFKDNFYITPADQGGVELGRPTIPLSDGTGEVVKVSANVAQFAVGDRVIPLFTQNWQAGPIPLDALEHTLGHGMDGVLAQMRVFPASGLISVPSNLRDPEAATLPCAGLTAWNVARNVTAGQTVLIRGTGAVALFCLQFAKALCARVIITSSSNERLEQCRAMGADVTINYRAVPDWDRAVRDATNGRGVDHVLETVSGETVAQSIAATAADGTIHLVGMMAPGLIDPFPILLGTVCLRGVRTGSRTMFEEMNAFIERHDIHPIIARIVPFDKAPEAFRHQQAGGGFGKIVVAIDTANSQPGPPEGSRI